MSPPLSDPADTIATLESLGAKLRKRKSGRLHAVDLSATVKTITDRQLDHLDPIQALEVLDLSGTEVTDLGLEKLRSHRQLKLLTLTGCPVSPEAIRALRQNLIGCRIIA
ncbi:MAG: hypothetical protein WDZ51_09175 [Pirellulaceae bacterium]